MEILRLWFESGHKQSNTHFKKDERDAKAKGDFILILEKKRDVYIVKYVGLKMP